MFDLRPVLSGTGMLLSALALAMCLPAAVDALHANDDWSVFAASAGVTFILGQMLIMANRQGRRGELSGRQTFLLTAFAWAGASLAAALPFAFSRLHLSPADAVFEAVSGLTATGGTVLRGLDAAPPGILLWRALLQWLGGMAFLVMAVAVLPVLNIGGMQFFRLDASTLGERMPRVAKVAALTMAIYAGFTVLLTLALWAAGMSRFPALLHAMSTISCGGFSTSDGSIGHWHSPAIDWVILVGMLIGGSPFVIYMQMIERRWSQAFHNPQLRWYLGILLGAALLISAWLILEANAKPLPALRHGAFAAASVLTGTGYATLDWGHWAGLPFAVLFFLALVGGCAGSTAGGLKIFRLQILTANARMQLVRLLHPHAVLLPQYDKKQIPEDVAESVLGFLFVYTLSFAVLAMLLGWLGMDFATAISTAAAALANLGPALTTAAGPMTGYGAQPDAIKWVLAAAMLFGRLEMFVVLALFARPFWKN